jgi:hypothetical protein
LVVGLLEGSHPQFCFGGALLQLFELGVHKRIDLSSLLLCVSAVR